MNVMIDLETLSTRKNAVIIAICAVKFDPHSSSKLVQDNTFYYKINIDSCTKIGMSIDKDTIEWWDKQPSVVREEVFGNPRYDIVDVLKKFIIWVKDCERVWSHGASFDIPILEEAFALCNLYTPWKYYNVRDTRTLYDLAQVSVPNTPSKHNPLNDCQQQIKTVQLALTKLHLN